MYTESPALGTINISAYSIQTDKKNKSPYVLITFGTSEILVCKTVIRAKGIKTDLEPLRLDSIPDLIDFRVDGQTQIIRVRTRVKSPYNIYIFPIRN